MIIGLSGWARVGKDTVGQILVEDHGFTREYFAKGVYRCAEALDPIIGWPMGNSRLSDTLKASPQGWHSAKDIPEVRRLLQRVGTEMGRREIQDMVWVTALANRLSEVTNPIGEIQGDYVITNVRFFNEANWIKYNQKGQVWRITRDGVSPANDHVSENELNHYPFDLVIHNHHSTIEDLQAHVGRALEYTRSKL